MSALQFLAIAPHGEFDVESLEVITAKDGTALVRIILGGRALAVRLPLEVLQQQIAQLHPAGTPKSAGARVLFSPLPEQTGRPSWAEVSKHTAAQDRPLPGSQDEASGVTSSEPASSPAAAAPAGPHRVTPGDLATNLQRRA